MPRPVPPEVSSRRRERLAALIDALGAARGARVTQREFAASISREQGTIAAILGGHRALGHDVLLAIVKSYGLPADYFDVPLRPDPRPFARRAVGDTPGAAIAATPDRGSMSVRAAIPSASYGSSDPALAEVLAVLQPDRAVAMALEALSRQGARHETSAWMRHAIAAQSAHERGALISWYDQTVASERGAEAATAGAPKVPRLARAMPKSSSGSGA